MPRKTTPHVSQVVEDCLRFRKAQIAHTSWVNQSCELRRFAREIGDPQIHLLTANHVEDYFTARADYAANTWNQIRTRLASFFEWCQRRGHMTPVTDLLADVRKRRVARKRRMQLGVVQLNQLLDSCEDPRERAFIAVAMNTGLRASTITSIKAGDVDLGRGELRVWISK